MFNNEDPILQNLHPFESCSSFDNETFLIGTKCDESSEDTFVEEDDPKIILDINLLGWETFSRTIFYDIVRKHDIIFAITHWLLISKGFKCCGQINHNEDHFLNKMVRRTPSELLPCEWNIENPYSILYKLYDVDYILQGILTPTKDVLAMRFCSRKSQNITYMCIDVECLISDKFVYGRKSNIYVKNCSNLIFRIYRELLSPIIGNLFNDDISAQTNDHKSYKLLQNEYKKESEEKYRRTDDVLLCKDMDKLVIIPETYRTNKGAIKKLCE